MFKETLSRFSYLILVLVTCPVSVTTAIFKRKRIYFGSQVKGIQSVMAGKGCHQEKDAAVHICPQSGSR